MADQCSFDIVSEVNMQELKNGLIKQPRKLSSDLILRTQRPTSA